MSEIIKEGKNRTYIKTCPECQCIFRFDEKEIIHIGNPLTRGYNEEKNIPTVSTIFCPYCTAHLRVENCDIERKPIQLVWPS